VAHYFVTTHHSPQQMLMSIETQCTKIRIGNSTRKFEAYLLTHNFWAWSSCKQRKKLKRPSNENLKDLNNVLWCNFNLAKQVAYEKGASNSRGRCNSSLGGKLGRESHNQCQQ
jgi:hypothetical protein